MTVNDIYNIAKIRYSNIPMFSSVTNVVPIIYLGVAELYRRFNLSIKVETVVTNSNTSSYTLSNSDVALLYNVYDITGRCLVSSDTVDSDMWEYKQINYNTFVLKKPVDSAVYALYSASPTVLVDGTDTVDLPNAMIDALLCYVGYMASAAIRSNTSIQGRPESEGCYQQFITACAMLEQQGFKIPLKSESLGVTVRGFV